MSIKKGDNVLVIAGKDKGKTGRVDRQLTSNERIVVEGVNMITRHVKARPGYGNLEESNKKLQYISLM